MNPAVEQVVSQSHTDTRGTEPRITVLTFLEETRILRPLVIVKIVVVRRVNGVLILIGIVLAMEEAQLETKLQAPMPLA